MAQTRPTYEVHIDTQGLPLDLTSPVETPDVKYYDAGIWLTRSNDRVFLPYRSVLAIREVPADAADDDAETAEPTAAETEPPSDPVE
jgi:hypothetical protein